MTQSPWFEAFFDPACILLLGAAAVFGLIAAWWLFPIGVALWLFLAVRSLRDPALRLNQTIQDRKDLAQRFQASFNQIQGLQISMYNAIYTTPPEVRKALKPVQTAVDQLLQQIYELCKRFSPLENYRLVTATKTNPEQELQKVSQQRDATTDPATKREYEESAQSIQQRLQKSQEVSDQLNRFDAQLNGIYNELGVILTEVMQAQSLSKAELKQKIPEILARINQEKELLRKLE